MHYRIGRYISNGMLSTKPFGSIQQSSRIGGTIRSYKLNCIRRIYGLVVPSCGPADVLTASTFQRFLIEHIHIASKDNHTYEQSTIIRKLTHVGERTTGFEFQASLQPFVV